MKTLKYITAIILIVLFVSCENEDCMDLNDSNTVAICEDDLILIQTNQQGIDVEYQLDNLQKPIPTPLSFQNIRTDLQVGASLTEFSANNDAYNSIDNRYFIFLPSQNVINAYDLTTNTLNIWMLENMTAPVVHNGTLFALQLNTPFPTPNTTVDYNIVSVDQTTGAITVLLNDTFVAESPFNLRQMSSATDGNGNLFFIGGSNLLTYNLASNTTTVTELEPTFDFIDNRVEYWGAEFRSNGNLMAIRRANSNLEPDDVSIVEFSPASPTTRNIVFDLDDNSVSFNAEAYSTTYDRCDDTYYLTSNNPAAQGTFTEINLTNTTFSQQTNANYLFGIATTNQ